jgi:hypothetical protein
MTRHSSAGAYGCPQSLLWKSGRPSSQSAIHSSQTAVWPGAHLLMQRALQFNYLKPALGTLECQPFRLERLLHTQEARGSSPCAPTIIFLRLQYLRARQESTFGTRPPAFLRELWAAPRPWQVPERWIVPVGAAASLAVGANLDGNRPTMNPAMRFAKPCPSCEGGPSNVSSIGSPLRLVSGRIIRRLPPPVRSVRRRAPRATSSNRLQCEEAQGQSQCGPVSRQ